VEVMRVVGVIQTMAAAAVVATLLEAAVLPEVRVLLLRVAVMHQAVEALHQEVDLEVAVIPCRQRSQAPVELEHLYRRAKRDTTSALRRTSPISQGLPPNRRRSRQSLEFQIHCLMWLQRNTLPRRWEARNS
jgi:hypothetical protein